jgi:HK97 gp10 family phage protein
MSESLQGANQLIAQLNGLADTDYLPALVEGSQVILEEMQRLTPVDTGDLKASERIEVQENSVLLVAGDGQQVDYPFYVELGTSKMQAQPYMRPAIDNKADEAMKVTAEAVNKLMEKAV